MERNTLQRRAIYHVLEESGRPLGPPEIFAAARSHAQGLGIATVYRTIKRLLDDGSLAQVDLPGEAPRYELSGKAEHDHFLCKACHRVFDIEAGGKPFTGKLPQGFTLEGTRVYLVGRCRDCTH